MRGREKFRFRIMYLMLYILLFSGVSITSCQSDVTDTNVPRPSPESMTPTVISPLKTGQVTMEYATEASTTPVEPSLTPKLGTPAPTSDDASQLTSMRAGRPWWSEDGHTLYFSTIGSDSQRWAIDLATGVIQLAPDILSPYRRAISLTAALIPTEVSQYVISVSPSGGKVIFPRQVAPTGPTEEACDGEACVPIPMNEIWLIDVGREQLTQLRMKEELIAMEMSFLWSGDESRVVISTSSSWTTGSDTPTIWIVDLSCECVYPIGARDNRISRMSISPDGDLVIYKLEQSESNQDSCDMYLWIVDSQESKLLPGLPCTSHFWLSDSRAVVFKEKTGYRSIFWSYNVMTFERREIASSVILPNVSFQYVLAPDGRSVAAVPYSSDAIGGIWLVRLNLLTVNQ